MTDTLKGPSRSNFIPAGAWSRDSSSKGGRPMLSLLVRIVVPVAIIVIVSEVSRRWPRMGALLLSLPLVSLLAFGASWYRDQDLKSLSSMARETLILVPLGLPFFVPLAFAERLGFGFWSAMGAGLVLACATIGLWLAFAQRIQ